MSELARIMRDTMGDDEGIEEWAKEVDRIVAALDAANADAEALAEAMERANDPHEPGCSATMQDPLDRDCNCGVRAALAAHDERVKG